MNVQITGVIEKIGEPEQVTPKLTKRTAIIITNAQYPQTYQIECVNDKIGIMDQFNVGDLVTINCNLNGRSWDAPDGNTKYFLSLQAWSVNLGGTPSQPDLQKKKPMGNIERNFMEQEIIEMDDDFDELPF